MRVLRGLGALLVLAVMAVGIPVGLIVAGGNPFVGLSAGMSWTDVLLRPVNDRALLGILAVTGWVVWAAFMACLVAEAISLTSGRRIRIALPGLRLGQRGIAVLLLAVVAMIAVPHHTDVTPAAADPGAPGGTHSATIEGGDSRSSAPAPTRESTKAKSDHHVHTVRESDWLWTLAERYYGDGAQWTKIANANPGIDPDELAVGQKLEIPDAKPSEGSAEATAGHRHTVRAGESLSSIADDAYGDTSQWNRIYQANKTHISDPDEIEIGDRLTIPTKRGDNQRQNAKADNERGKQNPDRQARDKGASTQETRDRAQQAEVDESTERAEEQNPTPDTPPATESAPPAPDRQQAPAGAESSSASPEVSVQTGVSVGLLLAVGLVSGLRLRRRRQMQSRRPGQMLPTPTPAALRVEDQVRHSANPIAVNDLNTVLTLLAGHCHDLRQDAPDLAAARIADHDIHLLLARPLAEDWNCPEGLTVMHDRSVLALDADALAQMKGRPEMAPPYPALVTLGQDEAGAHVLVNLESASALVLTAPDGQSANGALTAIALELCLTKWAQDLQVTFVGPVCEGLAAALDHPNVNCVDDTDRALAGLENLARIRSQHCYDDQSPATHRGDHNLADAWNPHVLLFGDTLTSDQAQRLEDVVAKMPRLAVAAVTTAAVEIRGAWTCTVDDTSITITPQGWTLTPTGVDDDTYQHILELLTVTGTTQTSPAPWWVHDVPDATVTDLASRRAPALDQTPDAATEAGEEDDDESAAAEDQTRQPETPAIRVSLQRRPLTGLGLMSSSVPAPTGPAPTDAASIADTAVPDMDAPMLRILGHCTILGATGEEPKRRRSRCLEVMLYLLEHPNASSQTIAQAHFVQRDYVRGVVSHLRTWLGTDPSGASWLPDNYSGRGYRFDERVMSDWDRVQRLIGRGVNTASDQALAAALAMVQGQPLTGADMWEAIEALRPQITAVIVDIAHELADRCLTAGDINGARWASGKGLLADPRNEVLLTDRIRTETRAGNSPEVRRLASAVSANARDLGVDLLDDTQEVLAHAML